MAREQFVPSEDTVIWRYMKLHSFLELLSGHLVQSRIDTLQDAAEGAFGWRNISFARAVSEELGACGDVADIIRRARMRAAATYWFEFDRESYGMWNVYGRTGESVAVETTVGALREVLGREGGLRIERMRYEPMKGEIGDLHTLFFHKRREYRDEREIRSVQIFPKPLEQQIFDQPVSLDDLNRLVKRIILAPDSRQTFVTALKRIVESVFAHEKKTFAGEICGSSLDQDLVPQ